MTQEQGPPAGWYPHPQMANTLRYWNGASWTGHMAPMAPRAPAGQVGDSVQTAGWICAFLVPVAGFVIGILCIVQGPKTEGIWMLIISVIFTVLWSAAFAQAATPAYY